MKKKQLFILFSAIIACILLITIITIVIIPQLKYSKAKKLMSSKNYNSSIEIFEDIINFRDSKQLIKKAKNLQADELILKEEYDVAYDVLKSMGNDDIVNKNIYERAIKLFEENNYGARILFSYIKEYADSSEKIKEIDFNIIRNRLISASIGDIIEIGRYEQDNNTDNGAENIEWIVLDSKDGKLFVLSKYCLDIDYFDDSFAYTGIDISQAATYASQTVKAKSSWKSSSLSYYLNNTFFENAFNEAEKKLITPTLYYTKNHHEESFETYNKVVLLSREEARQYFKTIDSLKAEPTAKAVEDGLDANNGYSVWWLRDTGADIHFASYVDESGILNSFGGKVNRKGGVRPALWITIPS